MALSQKLEMRQGQSLVMTPQLQQAIKLLQMSNFELQNYVEAELERNPLLDRDAASPEIVETTPAPEPQPAREEGEGDGEPAAAPDASDGPLTESGWASMRQSSGNPAPEGLDFAQNLSRETSLVEHLEDQLNLTFSDPARRLIGQHLLGHLNEAGYLATDLASIAETLGAPEFLLEDVLAVMQGFEPAGVFARDLQECLELQLRERNRLDPAMRMLIQNLDLVAKRDFVRLQEICGVDHDDMRDMIAELRALNPKPGNAFGSVIVQPVVPDVFVRTAQDGTWHVELNTETLPRVLVNNQYYARVSANAARETDKLYLDDCMSNATWLVKSLDQRARTILKVAREIVRQQDQFFLQGVTGLKPLNLRMVADAISMHESTVSRVTSNKYIGTPRGIFEMKYFFTASIHATESGDPGHSAEAVRFRIRKLIEAETAAKILSDDQLVDVLRGEGIEIARRTVAKYREALGFGSSVQRRREKKAMA